MSEELHVVDDPVGDAESLTEAEQVASDLLRCPDQQVRAGEYLLRDQVLLGGQRPGGRQAAAGDLHREDQEAQLRLAEPVTGGLADPAELAPGGLGRYVRTTTTRDCYAVS